MDPQSQERIAEQQWCIDSQEKPNIPRAVKGDTHNPSQPRVTGKTQDSDNRIIKENARN